MRTQIKRRMLALWLSVCMILTMMPSMAVSTFAETPESLTVTNDPDGTVRVTGEAGEGNSLKYIIVEGEKPTISSWNNTTTTLDTAKSDLTGYVDDWALFTSGNLKCTYDDNGKHVVVVAAADDGNYIKKAGVGTLANIKNTRANIKPNSVKIKGEDITGKLTSPIKKEEKTEVSLAGKIISLEMNYKTAHASDVAKFAGEPADDSKGASITAKLVEGPLSESEQVNVYDKFTNGTDMTGAGSLDNGTAAVDKYVIIQVKSEDESIEDYYVVKVHIAAAKEGAELNSAKAKGEDVSLGNPISEAEAGAADLSNAENVGSVSLTYEQAADTTLYKTFVPSLAKSSEDAAVEAKIVAALPELNSVEINGGTFEAGTSITADSEVTPIDNSGKAGTKWIVIKVTAPGKTAQYYVVKVSIGAADEDATLTGATIKGQKVELKDPISKTDAGTAKNFTADKKYYAEITVPYETAADTVTKAFDYTKAGAKAQAQACRVDETVVNGTGDPLSTAFTSALANGELKEKEAINGAITVAGGSVWVVIKATAENSAENYYIVKVTIAPAVGGANLDSVTIKGTKASLGKAVAEKDGKYEANLNDGQSAVGVVNIPYVNAKGKNNGNFVQFAYVLAANSEGASTVEAKTITKDEMGTSLNNVNLADKFDTVTAETLGNKDNTALTQPHDGTEFWIIVKVVAKNTTTTQYYAIKAKIGAPSKDAKLLGATIKGKTAGAPNALSALTDVDLTPEKGNFTEVELTYEQASSDLDAFVGNTSLGAEVTVKKLTKSEEDEGQTLTPGDEVKEQDIIAGSSSVNEDGETVWLFVEVKPESDVANKTATDVRYYVYKVVISGQYIIPETVKVGAKEYAEGISSEDQTGFDEIINDTNLTCGLTNVEKALALELSLDPEYSETKLKAEYGSSFSGNVYLHIQTVLNVEVTEYEKTTDKHITYDVTPQYRLVVNGEETLGSAYQALTKEYKDLPIPDNTTVEVTLPLPTGFTSENTLYIKHKQYVYTSKSVTANNVVFDNPHGFSQFTIEEKNPAVAKYGKTDYLTLQDAVDAIPAGTEEAEITLYSKPKAATVNMPVKITIKADSGYAATAQSTDLNDLKACLVAGKNIALEDGAPTGDGTDMAGVGLVFIFKNKPADSTTPGESEDPDDPTTGELTVSKKVVTDDDADKDKEFTFTVTVTADPAVNGSYSGMTFTNGVATITLKDGQSKTAIGLPAGATYKVEETAVEGFTSSATGATGTIGSIASTAAFTNTKDGVTPTPTPTPTVEPSENGQLVFTDDRQPKALLDRSTTDKDCSLKLAADDGDELTSIEVKSSDTKIVKVLKDNKLRYMDLGTAEITVTATGKSGKTYTITFPVTVTKLGRPTLTVSNKISKKAKTFTVTTSTVRGADGFIVKYSLKKNMSNSGKKKFACGKKLKRQPITVKKGKTTYYVKVRAYKKVDGKIVKYAWSKETEKIKSR